MERSEIVEKWYCLLKEYFGWGNSMWSDLNEEFSQYHFKANYKHVIAEYLLTESLVKEMKDLRITYYQGLDDFLREYHDAVYSHVKESFDTQTLLDAIK